MEQDWVGLSETFGQPKSQWIMMYCVIIVNIGLLVMICYDNNALLGNMIIIQIAIGMWFYDSEIAIIINDDIMIIIMFPFRIAIFMFLTFKQTHIMYW